MSRSSSQLKKCRRVLRNTFSLYQKKYKRLSPEQRTHIEDLLAALDRAILQNDVIEASRLVDQVETEAPLLFKKSSWEYIRDIVVAVVFALVVATLVRQMWFEPMEIPSGSMRPTFQELDRLIVSKTTFGVNLPAMPGHLYFDSDLVKRTGVFIFTTENMDVPDQNTKYFFILPGKKRFIKRCMGKPGDTLYFYGGKIYGIDEDGDPLSDYEEASWMKEIDSVPFITFEGKVVTAAADAAEVSSPVFFYQMNKPIMRLSVSGGSDIRGEIFDGETWLAPEESDFTYTDLWGMRGYAMARLLSPSQIKGYPEAAGVQGEGVLYMELRHSPNLTYPKPVLRRDQFGRLRPFLTPYVSLLPLSRRHLKAVMETMSTSRFIVHDGEASLERDRRRNHLYRPSFPNVPNGRYEFSSGVAYAVGWGGILKPLPEDHPLYSLEPDNVQRLYNLGVEMNTLYAPQGRNQLFYPSRYAYFRHGALYTMNGEIFPAGDPLLVAFNREEIKREQQSEHPYLPFKDFGRPSKETIEKYGLKIKEKGYLALGDNYADSSDSRVFGFVPQTNIRGAPAWLLWPPGSRWGSLEPDPYPWISPPSLVIWILIAIVIVICYTVGWIRNRRPIFIKKQDD